MGCLNEGPFHIIQQPKGFIGSADDIIFRTTFGVKENSQVFGVGRTVLVERFKGWDLGFSLFDAEFNALFDGIIFKIDILQSFKICPFFLNALGRTVAN